MTLIIISCLLCLGTGFVVGYFIAWNNYAETGIPKMKNPPMPPGSKPSYGIKAGSPPAPKPGEYINESSKLVYRPFIYDELKFIYLED
jgi:hypothetical protein